MTSPMVDCFVYCDELTWRSAVALWRLQRIRATSRLKVHVLDKISTGFSTSVLRRLLALGGVDIDEASFFAGHLRMPDGQAVYAAARVGSFDLAIAACERLLERSALLRRLNARWDRNTVFKHLSGSLHREVQEVTMRILVAGALDRLAGRRSPRLLLRERPEIDRTVLADFAPEIELRFYRGAISDRWREGRLAIPAFLAYAWLWRVSALFTPSRWSSSRPQHVAAPALLVLQEDDLSLDRSVRSQPHWLFPEDSEPLFRTLVLDTSSVPRQPTDAALAGLGVERIGVRELWKLRDVSMPIFHRVTRDFWVCARASVFGPACDRRPTIAAAKLLYGAGCLARLCVRENVRAFMTGENYMLHADAIQLVAPALDIVTLSYQYTNRVVAVPPQMLTTADIMVTMSRLFDGRWTSSAAAPRSVVHGGYPFDSAFARVRGRALERRRQMRAAGATFIICHFDETVQEIKYGLTSVADHVAEVSRLIQIVRDDSTVGLILKPQLQQNRSRQFAHLSDHLAELRATGRCVELSHGAHRNNVWPAEAAMSADIAIGHAFGATASLEAALAGTRSIMLNPYQMQSDHLGLYRNSDLLFSNWDEALAAIQEFRRGVRPQLGDWTPILNVLDPIRDGQAGRRLRRLLEHVTCAELPAERRSHVGSVTLKAMDPVCLE